MIDSQYVRLFHLNMWCDFSHESQYGHSLGIQLNSLVKPLTTACLGFSVQNFGKVIFYLSFRKFCMACWLTRAFQCCNALATSEWCQSDNDSHLFIHLLQVITCMVDLLIPFMVPYYFCGCYCMHGRHYGLYRSLFLQPVIWTYSGNTECGRILYHNLLNWALVLPPSLLFITGCKMLQDCWDYCKSYMEHIFGNLQ